MKVKEKLDEFTAIAMRAAHEKNAAEQAQIDAAYKNARDEARREAKRLSDERLAEVRQAAERHSNKVISDAATSARKALIAQRRMLTAKLFADVERRLLSYIATETYRDWLAAAINALAEQHPEGLCVMLRGADMGIAPRLDGAVTLAADDSNTCGGFLAQANGRSVRYDYTFARKLEEASASFNGFKITD